MRILMVTPSYLPSIGGVEMHVAEVAPRIAAAGHTVCVLATDPSGRLPAAESRDGVEIRRVKAYPSWADYHFAPAIRGIVANGGWDVVHVQSYHTLVAPLAMAAARSGSVPYVVTFHGGGHSSALRSRLRGGQLRVLRPLLAGASRLVALAEFEIDHYGRLLRLPPERFALIPNGADLPPPSSSTRDGDLLASVGRLERYKGHQHAIAALPAVRRERPAARLWIAGSGPYEGKLQRLAEQLGVVEAVTIRSVPPEDRQRMANELSRAAVVLLLSSFETQPLAGLEAAALGCRVVAADAPGLRELSARGLARPVAHPEDAEALARVIVEELDAPPLDRPAGLPTWDDCAMRLSALYEEVARAR